MSFAPKITFRGITRTLFERLRKKARQSGLEVIQPTGEAIKDGVRIQWKYDAKRELLELQCVKTPFWIDAARVQKRLRQEIESTLGAGWAA